MEVKVDGAAVITIVDNPSISTVLTNLNIVDPNERKSTTAWKQEREQEREREREQSVEEK